MSAPVIALCIGLAALPGAALAELRQCQTYSETETRGPRVVLMNESPDDDGAGKSGPRAGKWMVYDLTAITPPGTELVSVRLEGRMIISRGHYDGLCQIVVNVVPGSAIPHDPDPPWIGQATAGSTVGARVPWSVTVPVRYVGRHPRFLLRWWKSGQGATAPYPRGCNFGLNLWLVSACAVPTSP